MAWIAVVPASTARVGTVVSAPHTTRAAFDLTENLRILDDHFHDHCGVFGVFGHEEAAKLAYLGLYALQHRGQESAGIVSSDGGELYLQRAMGEVEEIFTPEVLATLPGNLAI